MRRLAAALLFVLSAPAQGDGLDRLCDGVAPEDGLCEVYRAERDWSWGRALARYADLPSFDKAVAVVIGIGAYDGPDYDPLSGRREDAERMRDLLIGHAEFDVVVTMTDRAATTDRIERLMDEILPPLLGERDRFFFHFSGHGETQPLFGGGARGHLVTSAARHRRNYTNMISMSDVQDWSRSIARARQSLWLIDACFSGLAAPQPMSRRADPAPGATAETTRRRLAQRAHHLLTAGLADEESLILDGRSVFTNAFIEAVRRGDLAPTGAPDGFVSLAEIEAYVATAVDREVTRANQRTIGTPYKMSPRRVVLHADDGQFFFIDRAALEQPAPVPPPPPGRIETGGAGGGVDTWYGDGRVRVVDPGGAGDATTIGAAVAAASPGDIIRVRPGHYRETVTIDKPLEIVGDGPRDRVIVEGVTDSAIDFSAETGRIADLTIRQAAGEAKRHAVDIVKGRLFLERNDISSQSVAAVGIRGAGADPVIRRNLIRDSAQSGIFVYDSARGLIEDNQIVGNTLHGVEIKTGADPVLRGNTIRDGQAVGVFVYDDARGRIEDNEITDNANQGIAIRSGADPLVRGNRVHGSGASGIYVYEGGLGLVVENDVAGSANSGVTIATEGDPVVRANTIRDSQQSGVYVYDDGRGRIEDNTITGNAYQGISVKTGGFPFAVGNRVSESGYYGVRVREQGGGVFRDNDLRENERGAWLIEDDAGEVTRRDNLE